MDDFDEFTAEEKAYMDSRGAQPLAKDEPAPEAPKPEEPKPEVKAEEPKPEAKSEDDPEVMKLVPLSAVEAERARGRAARDEAKAIREEAERLKAELAELRAKSGAPAQAQPQQGEEPDIDKDPIGYIKWHKAQEAARKEAMEKAERDEVARERISGIGRRHASEFVKTNPNYFDTTGPDGKSIQGAYPYLRQAAFDNLAAKYPEATERQLWDVINLHELNEIQTCVQNGVNAAQHFWNMAVQQGFKVPEAPKPETPKPSEAERIAEIEKVQRAARSLGAVPAGGGEPKTSLDTIAAMSDDEFENLPRSEYMKALRGR